MEKYKGLYVPGKATRDNKEGCYNQYGYTFRACKNLACEKCIYSIDNQHILNEYIKLINLIALLEVMVIIYVLTSTKMI